MRFSSILPLLLIITITATAPLQSVSAQDGQNPIYIVQPGDSLGAIAARFGVPIENLISANNINDPNAIFVGMQLVIPGLEGITGILNTINVQLGENLSELSIRYQVPRPILIRLNRITSPLEIHESANLIIPQQEEVLPEQLPIQLVGADKGVLEAAVLSDSNPWHILENNHLNNSIDYFSQETLFLPSSVPSLNKTSFLEPVVDQITLDPTVLVQGRTSSIRVNTSVALELSGQLGDNDLHFFQESPNIYVAYQGIHGLTEPGLASLMISGSSNDELVYSLDQMVQTQAGNYGSEELFVDPSTIDPSITEPENEQILSVTRPVTPTRYWEKPFVCPVEKPVCIKSWFGTRRSYNNGAYENFHSGLDFGLCAPENTFNIYATANGKVIFTEQLIVRGNMTVIDHGWGIYSAVYHQEEINVQVGQHVEAGQLIGLIGATGRVTGPHLHYEIWVNGVLVNPFDWLENSCD